MKDNNDVIDVKRRQLILGTASGLALVALPIPQSHAGFWGDMLRVAPQRIIGGLIFDAVKVVLVEVGKWAINTLFNNTATNSQSRLYYASSSPSPSYHKSVSSIPDVKPSFDVEAYKASVVMTGIADYERYKELENQRKVKLLLSNDVDKERFTKLIEYLRDEKVSIKTPDFEVSRRVGRYTEPNDLVSVDYFVADKFIKEHFKNMEEITGAGVFRKLTA